MGPCSAGRGGLTNTGTRLAMERAARKYARKWRRRQSAVKQRVVAAVRNGYGDSGGDGYGDGDGYGGGDGYGRSL